MTTADRIRTALQAIGLPTSLNSTDILSDYGIDSLLLALLIIELEKEFQVTIPVIPLRKECFTSIETIEKHLIKLGAK